MGVDYDANYGIGYEVKASENIDEELLGDGLEEYLYNELGDNFDSFTVGNAFSGEIDGVYVTIKNPFKNGLDLTEEKAALERELERIQVTPVSLFGGVGGLRVW